MSKNGDHPDVVIVTLGNGNTYNVNSNAEKLSNDSNVRSSVAELSRVVSKPSINKIESFYGEGEAQSVEIMNKGSAERIQEACYFPEECSSIPPQYVDARIILHSPVYDQNAKAMKFKYDDKVIPVDISETNINDKITRDGYTTIRDVYFVKMEITETMTRSGKFRNKYKIINVYSTWHAPVQQSLNLPPSDPKR